MFYLGIDFGTTGVRTGLYDRNGTEAGFSSVPYETFSSRPGYAEQRPMDWWEALGEAVDAAFAGLDEQPFGDESLERRNPFREARRVESVARTQAEDRPFLEVLRR